MSYRSSRSSGSHYSAPRIVRVPSGYSTSTYYPSSYPSHHYDRYGYGRDPRMMPHPSYYPNGYAHSVYPPTYQRPYYDDYDPYAPRYRRYSRGYSRGYHVIIISFECPFSDIFPGILVNQSQLLTSRKPVLCIQTARNYLIDLND